MPWPGSRSKTAPATTAARRPLPDDGPEVPEDDGPRDKLVLIAFPDAAPARPRAASPACPAIDIDRLAGREAAALPAQGFTAA